MRVEVEFLKYPRHTPVCQNICLCFCPEYTPLEYIVLKYEDGNFVDINGLYLNHYVEKFTVIEGRVEW